MDCIIELTCIDAAKNKKRWYEINVELSRLEVITRWGRVGANKTRRKDYKITSKADISPAIEKIIQKRFSRGYQCIRYTRKDKMVKMTSNLSELIQPVGQMVAF